MIDVLKVDRRGDRTGVMLRGWIREAWLSKTTERRKKVMMKMDSQVTHDIQTTCTWKNEVSISHQNWILNEIRLGLRKLNSAILLVRYLNSWFAKNHPPSKIILFYYYRQMSRNWTFRDARRLLEFSSYFLMRQNQNMAKIYHKH